MDVIPRHVICILGHWQNLDEVAEVVARVGGPGFELDRTFSQLAPDSRMAGAFDASFDRVRPSMTDEDWQAIRAHTAVAYVLSPPLPQASAEKLTGRTLSLTAAILRAGGVAAKGESAGIAHGRTRWLELGDEYAAALQAADEHRQAAILYGAWVRRPLLDNQQNVFYSCGMHLLGQQDTEIETWLDVEVALEWMDLLGLYRVANKPQRAICDGEGFRLRDGGPRRVMRLGPCLRYERDDFFFNPYGYTRLVSDQR